MSTRFKAASIYDIRLGDRPDVGWTHVSFWCYTARVLSFNYVASISSNGILLIANFMNICQGDTISYRENHGTCVYRKSTRFPFYEKRHRDKPVATQQILTYSPHYIDPTLTYTGK
jgi:hypothetical protein